MGFRFIRVLALAAALAAVFAGVARALDFDDEDPEPFRGEVGMVVEYEIGTHAGCLPHRLEILSGQLPPGTKLRWVGSKPPDSTTHVVEGVLTQGGTFSAWLAVRDCDNRSSEALFTFEVGPRRFSIATPSLPAAAMGAPYSATLQTSGVDSNTTWKVTAGSLPAGLALSKDGVISGTPTAGGSSTFTVEATGVAKDFSGTRVDTKQLTVNVVALAATLSRPTAEAGVPFRASLVGSGGQAPYRWSATGAPAGLTVAADGTLSGTPKRAGSYTFGAHVVDATGAESTLQMRLVVRPRLVISAKRLPPAKAGHAYLAKVATRGGLGPFRWSARGLPPGLKLVAGTISGKAPAARTARVTLRIRDALGAVATKTLVLTVR
jgi:large repetitive protein